MRKKLLTYLCAVLILSSCGLISKQESRKEPSETKSSADAPFDTKLPQRFAADLEISAIGDTETFVRKYFVAKNEESLIEKFGIGTEDEFWILWTKDGGVFRIKPSAKTYSRVETDKFNGRSDSLSKSLTAQMIYRRSFKTYEKLGIDNGLTKYQVEIEDSNDTRTYLFIDEKLNFPVKQESYSVRNDDEELVFKTEFKNISTTPDPTFFAIPEDFKEVS